jgi:hypothetical protein
MFQLYCRSFLRVSKVTEKIKTRSKPTPSENFNSHPLLKSTAHPTVGELEISQISIVLKRIINKFRLIKNAHRKLHSAGTYVKY